MIDDATTVALARLLSLARAPVQVSPFESFLTVIPAGELPALPHQVFCLWLPACFALRTP